MNVCVCVGDISWHCEQNVKKFILLHLLLLAAVPAAVVVVLSLLLLSLEYGYVGTYHVW